MEDINKGARPDHVAPYLVIQALDFKVTDPTAADPDAPARMFFVNQPFTMHLIVKLEGIWKKRFNGVDELWVTNFYADSIGIDVGGEIHWDLTPAALPGPIAPDTYDLTYTVAKGLPVEGLYELGAITRLPSMLVNAYVEGYHIEIAER